MKRIVLIGLIVVIALAVFFVLRQAPADTLDISVRETAEGFIIENKGDVDYIIFVTRPDDQQRFDLAPGEKITLADISEPVEVSAVKK